MMASFSPQSPPILSYRLRFARQCTFKAQSLAGVVPHKQLNAFLQTLVEHCRRVLLIGHHPGMRDPRPPSPGPTPLGRLSQLHRKRNRPRHHYPLWRVHGLDVPPPRRPHRAQLAFIRISRRPSPQALWYHFRRGSVEA